METSASNDTNNNVNTNNNTTTTTTVNDDITSTPITVVNGNAEVPSPPASSAESRSESPVHSASVAASSSAVSSDDEEGDETFHEIENELVSLNLENQQEQQEHQAKNNQKIEESLQDMEVTCIKESLKETDEETDENDELCEVDLEDVPLNEVPDTLSPLLVDNHTHVQHQEILVNTHYVDNGIGGEKRGSIGANTLNPLARSFMLRDNDSSDEGKDKNGEDDGPMEIPDDETCVKIVEQVEFYFSNDSLLKDAFLLKHVRRNKEGFVSLKLVSSFKRVRQICKDWRAVGYAIKKCSGKIELNDISTKIRRIDALPLYDETLPSRTIVATGLPFDKLTIEKVSDIFSKCGEIALVRVLRPGGQIPADVRQFMNKHPELLENECALVEFTESAAARVAQRMEGIYVLELVLPKKKTGKKANVTKLVENLKYSSESDNERNRGGENVRFLKRNNSVFYVKPDYGNMPSVPRRSSCGEVSAFEAFQAKRFQNLQNVQSLIPQPVPERRFSNCSDGYSSCTDVQSSRRSSMCSATDLNNGGGSRRFSTTTSPPISSESAFSRRYSNCSDMMCTNCRRTSDHFRRASNGSAVDMAPMRKFSVERRFSNTSDRRISMEHERKISAGSLNNTNGGGGIVYERKYSNGFDPYRKLSNTDQYCNGRRISTDSGYDRRTSFGSDHSNFGMQNNAMPSSPVMNNGRSRSGSLYNAESLVRTPIGPDGSKGFQRARRIGQVVPPI